MSGCPPLFLRPKPHPVWGVARWVAAGLVAFVPPDVFAQHASLDPGGSIGQVLAGLAAVLVLLFGALVLLKRLTGPRGAAAGLLHVVAATAVGPRERVVLVEVGETWLIVGVAPGRVSALHTLPRSVVPAAGAATPAPAVKEFSTWLTRITERNRHGR